MIGDTSEVINWFVVICAGGELINWFVALNAAGELFDWFVAICVVFEFDNNDLNFAGKNFT